MDPFIAIGLVVGIALAALAYLRHLHRRAAVQHRAPWS